MITGIVADGGCSHRHPDSVSHSGQVVSIAHQGESSTLVEAGSSAGLHLVRAVGDKGIFLIRVIGMGRLRATVRPVAVRPGARAHGQGGAAVRLDQVFARHRLRQEEGLAAVAHGQVARQMRVHAAVVVEILLHAPRLAADRHGHRPALPGQVSLQHLPVFFELGVEEHIQDRVQASGQREEDQRDRLHDLGADRDGGDERREGEEGHGAEEDAVGEDEPRHVLDRAGLRALGEVLRFQVAVEFGVDDGHQQERQGV